MNRTNSWKMVIIIMLVFCCGCAATHNQRSNNTEKPTATSQTTKPDATQNSLAPQPSPSEDKTTPVASPVSTANLPGLSVNKQIIINEKSDGTRGTFYIGQSHIDVEKALNNLKIEIIYDVDTTIDTDLMGFSFNEEGNVYEISIASDSGISTTAGLSFGASYEDMVRIYGSDYTKTNISTDTIQYYYKIGDHYFYAKLNNDSMTCWGIIKTKSNVKLGQ